MRSGRLSFTVHVRFKLMSCVCAYYLFSFVFVYALLAISVVTLMYVHAFVHPGLDPVTLTARMVGHVASGELQEHTESTVQTTKRDAKRT